MAEQEIREKLKALQEQLENINPNVKATQLVYLGNGVLNDPNSLSRLNIVASLEKK